MIFTMDILATIIMDKMCSVVDKSSGDRMQTEKEKNLEQTYYLYVGKLCKTYIL